MTARVSFYNLYLYRILYDICSFNKKKTAEVEENIAKVTLATVSSTVSQFLFLLKNKYRIKKVGATSSGGFQLFIPRNSQNILVKSVSFYYRAMLCIRGTSHGPVYFCLCLSVSVSVTSRCSTKTAKHRITQTTPHDTPGILVFWCQRSSHNSTGVTPYGGAKCRWGGSKSATFDQ